MLLFYFIFFNQWDCEGNFGIDMRKIAYLCFCFVLFCAFVCLLLLLLLFHLCEVGMVDIPGSCNSEQCMKEHEIGKVSQNLSISFVIDCRGVASFTTYFLFVQVGTYKLVGRLTETSTDQLLYTGVDGSLPIPLYFIFFPSAI